MHTSLVTISSENIANVAQKTIVPLGIKCDWVIDGRDGCPVVLACWESLKKHYICHTHLSKKQKFGIQCQIRKCNASIHTSLDALRNHVEISHMSRVPVICPISCSSTIIHRSSTIRKHFTDEHGDLNEKIIQLPSNILCPLWTPFYPSKIALPPPLPPNPPPGCALVISIPSTSFTNRTIRTPTSVSYPPISPFTSPRKHLQKQIPKKDQAEGGTESDELSVPEFDPLPGYSEAAHGGPPRDLILWRRPEVFNIDVSRPQRMHDTPIAEAPTSILYDVFAKRVDELELQGLINK